METEPNNTFSPTKFDVKINFKLFPPQKLGVFPLNA